ncbi:MMPL family transporter [Streptomyces candidus]|uniref:RND superfamily putative drug exporter n=1 Tax=Streptomyces candidus TaxID=67283 RepID=A0A7X0HEH6_9ACTN|nr:MMPL family transporter [Streptomyces candidus]MBB6436161.1 RND superfamily putative drug exporter [Streptomyces candidus]GHH43839.1 putative conserved membrane protein, MmpL family [Streptomyces candidus]
MTMFWTPRRSVSALVATAVAALIALVALPAALGALGTGGLFATGTESDRAQSRAEQLQTASPDLILAVADRGGPGPWQKQVRTRVRTLTSRLSSDPEVGTVRSFALSDDPWLRSRDGRTGLVTVSLIGSAKERRDSAERLVPQARAALAPLRVEASGTAWATSRSDQRIKIDLLRAELLAAPLVLLLLVLTYGSLSAAMLPVLVAALVVLCAVPVLGILAQYTDISTFAVNAAAAIGFGLSVDFTLFILARYREENARGTPRTQALEVALRTSGRSVLCSAAVITSCLAAVSAVPVPLLRSLSVAGITVTLLAALAALTTVPAALTLLGDRIDSGDPLRRLRRSAIGEVSTFWRTVARGVTNRPLAAAAGALVVLGVLAWPAFETRLGVPDERGLPQSAPVAQAAADLRQRFTAPPERLHIVVTQGSAAAVSRYAAALARQPHVHDVRVLPSSSTRPGERMPTEDQDSVLVVAADVAPDSQEGARLVQAMRSLPAPGATLIGGQTAQNLDTVTTLRRSLPWAAAATAMALLVSLTLFTRSVIAPLKALAVATLSLAASAGMIAWAFQGGHANGLLGHFTLTGTLDGCLLVFTLAVAFALAIDYEVFLLGRIKEEFDQGRTNRDSVVEGIAHTGRLMTSAAAALALSTAAMTTAEVTMLKLVGAGIASAAILDAVLVRGVLVPAVMTLLGPANWWSPRVSLRREGTNRPPDRRAESATEIG